VNSPEHVPAAAATAETNKGLVRRLVQEVLNHRRLDVIDELYDPRLAPAARRWIEPFLASFSDVHMRIDDLIAEDDTVVGRFSCSGTHTGAWLGHPPTGRRFTDVAEVYIFRIADGRIVRAWGLEDNLSRLRQLGLMP
jgi:predicted ester cyclase